MKQSLKILVSIGLIVFLSQHSFGQARLVRSLIVLNNGDSLRGWIRYRGWERLPRSISFSRDSSVRHLTGYGIGDLRYFEIAGVEAYERAIIRKDSVGLDTVFLRLLVKGQKLSLYKGNSDLFYVREQGGIYEEAVPFVLKTYAEKYELSSLFSEIDAADNNESAFIRIVMELNSHSGAITYTIPVIRNKLHWYIGAGTGISRMSISGDKSYLGQISFSNPVVMPYLL